jgi:hypothetical protein
VKTKVKAKAKANSKRSPIVAGVTHPQICFKLDECLRSIDTIQTQMTELKLSSQALMSLDVAKNAIVNTRSEVGPCIDCSSINICKTVLKLIK